MAIATLISQHAVTEGTVDVVSRHLPDIEQTRRLSERAVEIVFGGSVNADSLRQIKDTVYEATEEIDPKLDVIITPRRLTPRLFVFDMDSTLIQQEVIDLIASYADVEAQVSKITEAAMNGEIDFNESLAQRVALLKGIPATVFESLKEKVTFTPGARELTRALAKLGVKMAVLSGGFVPLAGWVQNHLGLDYMYANNLEVEDRTNGNDGQVLTGRTVGPIVNSQRKAQLLKEIAHKEGFEAVDAVAVGDGSNDLEMMATAGFGVAFNAKPRVQQLAPSKLNTRSLQDILYILGYDDDKQKTLIEC